VAVEEGDRCLLALVSYLERNDFTAIQQVTHRVIKAKDGAKVVYVWLNFNEVLASVPTLLFRVAAHDRARVDVITVMIDGDRADIRHLMNVEFAQ